MEEVVNGLLVVMLGNKGLDNGFKPSLFTSNRSLKRTSIADAFYVMLTFSNIENVIAEYRRIYARII